MWFYLTLVSALFLGLYDIAKKRAVSHNAVLPVLFISTLSGALVCLPLLLLSCTNPDFAKSFHLYIENRAFFPAHLLIMGKSLIVGLSWVLSYFALKHLPISLAAPIRATAPLFTISGAILFFGERPTALQWGGITLIITSYFIYSQHHRKSAGQKSSLFWILCMILAALTGALSGGYDKYLLQIQKLPSLFVLSWFLIYLSIILFFIVLFLWAPVRHNNTPFTFKKSILLIGILLVAADIAYMNALADPIAKLSLVSPLRRSNVLISFAAGIILFKEGNLKARIIPFLGIIAGLILIFIDR